MKYWVPKTILEEICFEAKGWNSPPNADQEWVLLQTVDNCCKHNSIDVKGNCKDCGRFINEK